MRAWLSGSKEGRTRAHTPSSLKQKGLSKLSKHELLPPRVAAVATCTQKQRREGDTPHTLHKAKD